MIARVRAGAMPHRLFKSPSTSRAADRSAMSLVDAVKDGQAPALPHRSAGEVRT
jgi:hypothetical protein